MHVGVGNIEKAKKLIHQLFPGSRCIPFGIKNHQYVMRGYHDKFTKTWKVTRGAVNAVGTREISPVDFQDLPEDEDIDTEEAPPPQTKKKENATPEEEQSERKIPIELRIEEKRDAAAHSSDRITSEARARSAACAQHFAHSIRELVPALRTGTRSRRSASSSPSKCLGCCSRPSWGRTG